MKITGPNQTNFNPYKNQIQQHMDMKKSAKPQDQLQISSQAKQLQENTKVNAEREAYVQEIKNRVESGEYTINFEKTAQKMIDFWSKQ
ncbi:flagellar biosynthesis anti-sigma factor FlgM [Ornithinibacillus sp. BX22]|uniref:Negative regulator of flagellin synthesis n=2 Tax=Ornithinibacillus TaxID=484508 RepID=A0A923L7I2_9BACI|nr:MULTISPECIES: flagellar biosynthesis anti-sigma factor FlgM [Ornithinibacillus]MBC5637903.1 flagellar biosynthesis anti-sigma factor FlgM [Ornithinibacillus hominis]MBS3681733.1 flagellar biosynthesis anti-sigma factor FlgM [Ornithinibacillus massiliensis]